MIKLIFVHVNYEEVARRVIKDIGYDKDEYGFNYKTLKILNLIKEQSPDIRQGIEKGNLLLQGAGDQGIMFGYASNESEGYMPLPITIAHKLVRVASALRKDGTFKYSRPDMKSSVTIEYNNYNKPRIDTILMSCQHDPDFKEVEFKEFIKNNIMIPVAKSFGLNTDFKVLINPTGRFVVGGPMGDTGLTGRKIIVDTYGGSSRHEEIDKYYLALVKGVPANKKGTITAPLLKNELTKEVKIASIKEGAKEAITEYEVVASCQDYSLLKVHLLTGRTHQIRVHLSYIGCPVVGDAKYGDFALNKEFFKRFAYKNQFLHSYRFVFGFLSGDLAYLSNKEFKADFSKNEREILSALNLNYSLNQL